MRRLSRIVWGATWLACVVATRTAAAEADAEEDPGGADGLRTDLERLVASEESSGWFLDSTHYDAIHAALVQSTCRATPEARRLALGRLFVEISKAGDPRALYDAAGSKVTAAFEHAIHLERMRNALERAMRVECPYWVRPTRGYDGRQTDRNRFTLNAEIGTLLQVRYAAEKVTVGASPSIRVLAGYAFGHIGVLVGPEFSAGPMLGDASTLVLNYFPAVPVVVRLWNGNWIYSIETGFVSVLTGDNTGLSYGVRGGAGIGLMALRTRYFIPWAGMALYYEHYFEGAGRSSAELLRGGLRIGIIYDP